MGDRGGKKDRDKRQKEQSKKKQEKERKAHDKNHGTPEPMAIASRAPARAVRKK
jgi:hypothetical protein